jgi:hypothetical protein
MEKRKIRVGEYLYHLENVNGSPFTDWQNFLIEPGETFYFSDNGKMRKYIVIEWVLGLDKDEDDEHDYDIHVGCQEVKHDDDIQKMLLRDMKLKDILK